MQEASKSKLPLSRLYYWSPAVTLPGCSEEVMLCSVPLIDSNGNVFGVCGFEISAMLFKLSQMPDSSKFARTFCLLAPIKDDIIDSSAALYSGGYPAQNLTLKEEDLHIEKKTNSLFSYAQESGDIFVGLHRPVRLYPEDSAFAKHKWISAIMIPAEDIKYSLTRFNLQLAFLLMLLMILGAVISFFLSRQYLKPIVDGIDMIKAKGLKGPPRTNIPEIDDLIEFLSMHNEKIQEQKDDTLASEVLDKFLENTKTLSPAERAVFDLYVEGYNAKEISEKLCLSINTIKTHNKRIYMKLNVASRKELLLYVQMLKEAGREP
jgi:DNA-binding CsgD family transcriptional regulator